MVGHEFTPLNKTSLRLWDWTQDQDVHTVAAGFEFRSNKSKKIWNDEASELPSHYEYLYNIFEIKRYNNGQVVYDINTENNKKVIIILEGAIVTVIKY